MSTRGQRGHYENCELVYRYGPALRDDPRHTGCSWDGFESETYTDEKAAVPAAPTPSSDLREGALAWKQKRAPVFQGC